MDVLWTALQVVAALVVVGLFLAFLASRDKAGFLGALATVPVALVVGAVMLVRKGSGAGSSPEARIAPPEDRPGDPVVCLFFALVEPPRPEGDVWWGYRSDVLREADGHARPGRSGPPEGQPWVDLETARRVAKDHGVPVVEA